MSAATAGAVVARAARQRRGEDAFHCHGVRLGSLVERRPAQLGVPRRRVRERAPGPCGAPESRNHRAAPRAATDGAAANRRRGHDRPEAD